MTLVGWVLVVGWLVCALLTSTWTTKIEKRLNVTPDEPFAHWGGCLLAWPLFASWGFAMVFGNAKCANCSRLNEKGLRCWYCDLVPAKGSRDAVRSEYRRMAAEMNAAREDDR